MRAKSRAAEAAEALRKRLGLSREHIVGLRFAINVFIATSIVWFTLKAFSDTNPIWAIASMVAASDPEPLEARRMFRSRVINVVVGCASGLFFLLVGSRNDWMVPLSLAITVLISTWFIRVKTMWRQAPITAAIVIAAGLTTSSAKAGIGSGLHKVGEVIFGCFVGAAVSWFMSRFWLLDLESPDDDGGA